LILSLSLSLQPWLRSLALPTDAFNSDVVAVQLKSYKQKDAYFTVAVFKDYVTAREFVLEFPTIPGSRLRIIDCFHNVLLVTDPVFPVESKHRMGSTDWWLDQSREIKECVGISEPLLPKFSLRNVANKLLKSFVAA